MNKIFFFKNINVYGMQCSSGFTVGFPAITAFVGAAEAFSIRLSEHLNLPANSFKNKGILVGFSAFQFIDAYKKNRKPKSTTYEQVVQAYCNSVMHLAFCVESTTKEAQIEMEKGFDDKAKEVLEEMSLAKGRLENVRFPMRLKHNNMDDVLRLMPHDAFIVTDASYLLREMRNQDMDLAEGLISATLRPDQRTTAWREFFENYTEKWWRLAAVQTGYQQIDDTGLGVGVRLHNHEVQSAFVASPTLGLVRFQKAASVRMDLEDNYSSSTWNMVHHPPHFWMCQGT